jgi:chorismate mutase
VKLLLRGVRGATTAEANDQEQIMGLTAELLTTLVSENAIDTEDIAAIIFSSTPDLNAAFPAKAARQIGWADVPLFGTQEIEHPDGVQKCIRVLMLWNTDKRQKEIKHVYLRDAAVLRQDIVKADKTE